MMLSPSLHKFTVCFIIAERKCGDTLNLVQEVEDEQSRPAIDARPFCFRIQVMTEVSDNDSIFKTSFLCKVSQRSWLTFFFVFTLTVVGMLVASKLILTG